MSDHHSPSRRFTAALPLLLMAVVACATATNGGGRDRRAPIMAEELDQAPVTTVLEAVRLLRPSWLARLNGAFLDGARIRESRLETMSVHDIAEIRLISADAATARYGARALSGYYLDVKTRR